MLRIKLPHVVHPVRRVIVDTVKDTWTQMKEAELLLYASSLAYTTILSIIPALAISFAIFQAFGGIERLYATIEPLVLENLTEGASEEAMTQIRRFIGKIHGGALGAGGLIGLIITTMTMLSSIETAINRVWRAPLTRSLFQRVAYYWLFITLGPLALSIMIGAATSTAAPIERFLPSGSVLFLITGLLFSAAYKWVPNRKVHYSPALFSGFITAAFWNLARVAYSIYNQKAVTYNKVYGSLGAIPILLVWIYIVWLIVLSGAALTVALEKRIEFRDEE